MQDDFKVHDIQVTEAPHFTPNGVEMRKQVRFWVGNHGPFTRQYDKGAGDATQIRADIDKQVQELRLVKQAEGM